MIKEDLKKRKSRVKSAVIVWAVIVCIGITMTGCGNMLSWPVPSEKGAMLYVGSSTSIPNIDSLQVGFILSADKTEISDLTVIVNNLRSSSSQIGGSVEWLKMSFIAVYPVQSPTTDIIFNQDEAKSSLTGLTFTDDGAQAELKYVHVKTTSNNEEVSIIFPSTSIVFKIMKTANNEQ